MSTSKDARQLLDERTAAIHAHQAALLTEASDARRSAVVDGTNPASRSRAAIDPVRRVRLHVGRALVAAGRALEPDDPCADCGAPTT